MSPRACVSCQAHVGGAYGNIIGLCAKCSNIVRDIAQPRLHKTPDTESQRKSRKFKKLVGGGPFSVYWGMGRWRVHTHG